MARALRLSTDPQTCALELALIRSGSTPGSFPGDTACGGLTDTDSLRGQVRVGIHASEVSSVQSRIFGAITLRCQQHLP